MSSTTDTLLKEAEQILMSEDFTAILPYAAALESSANSPEVYNFFKRLARVVVCSKSLHIGLFSHCLDAVYAHNPSKGEEFLLDLLRFTESIDNAASAPSGILH